MCDLLVISANQPVPLAPYWTGFRRRGKTNPDGWGYSYVKNGRFQSRRYPTRIDADPRGAEPLEHFKDFSLFIGHVRQKVTGIVAAKNAQPFVDPRRNMAIAVTANDQCGIRNRFRSEVAPELTGTTGAEVLFRLILRAFDRTGRLDTAIEETLARVLTPRRLKAASLSLTLSNGREVYAFRHRKPMFYVQKGPAVVLTTVKLTNDRWRLVPAGRLLVAKSGRCSIADYKPLARDEKGDHRLEQASYLPAEDRNRDNDGGGHQARHDSVLDGGRA
jgi:predicted glutamine amidotransferase